MKEERRRRRRRGKRSRKDSERVEEIKEEIREQIGKMNDRLKALRSFFARLHLVIEISIYLAFVL